MEVERLERGQLAAAQHQHHRRRQYYHQWQKQ